MLKFISVSAMVALCYALSLNHMNSDLPWEWTCKKYYFEPIEEGETGMVGPKSNVTFSSLKSPKDKDSWLGSHNVWKPGKNDRD